MKARDYWDMFVIVAPDFLRAVIFCAAVFAVVLAPFVIAALIILWRVL